MKRQFIQTVLTLLQTVVVAAGLSACTVTTSSTPDLTPITVQLQWIHQAEFAGFYAADQNGYYNANGIAATFLQGGSQTDSLAAVLAGEAQFGTAIAGQLIAARARNQPVRAIAVVYRRSPVVFVARADSGITRPEDFAGQKIRVVSSLVPSLHAMTARVGVTPNQYTEVILPSDPDLFASNQVPIWGAYLDGFVLTLQQLGYDLNIIYPDDYGVHFYADTIFTTDDLIDTQPDLVRRFLQATLKGWRYAIENPAEAGTMVGQYKPDADPALETKRMAALLPLVNTGVDHIGWMTPEVWAGMEQTLREQGVLTQPVSIDQVYTHRFLAEVYETDQ